MCLLFGIAGLPIVLGIPTVQAQKKAGVKIQKEKPTTPPKKPVEGVTDEEGAEEEAVEDKEKDAYSYDPTNKVDPFKSFIIVKRELEEEREKEKPRTYLETLDLSQLTLSAIVISSVGKWALVKDSRGEGHVIKIGTPIGRKRGQVIKILDKEVVVREYHRDFRGKEQEKYISMSLPEAD